MANPLLRWLLREVPEAAEGLAKRVAAQFAEREVNAATRTSAKDALEAIMRQRPEGLNFAAKPPARSLAVADLAVPRLTGPAPPAAHPRARQKPQVRTDNPGGDWLKYQRQRSDESGMKVSGAVTGYLERPIELDPQKLAVIPGASGERRVPGDPQYDNLRPLVEREGLRPDSPILVGINHRGEPYIIEGNTRTAVARDLGLRSVPAEVRYFAGGEQVGGLMEPGLLEHYMPPSELSLDPNFRKWFGNSRLADDYGEPMMLYHGTRGDITAFDPARIGQSDFGASGRGFYFSQDPGTAGLYSKLSRGSGDPNMLAAYLSAQNPLELGSFLPRDVNESELLTRRAQEGGHDAIIVRSPKDNMLNEVVVFKPTQIKSATGNRGTYDPNDPDIRKARGGRVRNPLSVRR